MTQTTRQLEETILCKQLRPKTHAIAIGQLLHLQGMDAADGAINITSGAV